MLIEILRQLPAASVLRFQYVSKFWLLLLRHIHFTFVFDNLSITFGRWSLWYQNMCVIKWVQITRFLTHPFIGWNPIINTCTISLSAYVSPNKFYIYKSQNSYVLRTYMMIHDSMALLDYSSRFWIFKNRWSTLSYHIHEVSKQCWGFYFSFLRTIVVFMYTKPI